MVTRLLLVEDDDDIRLVLRLALEDEGYDVVEAISGEEGLERFAAEPVDLALVDLRLPGMHGFEVCRQLRQHSTVPIIIITAQTDSHDVVAGLEAGADDYVTKPLVPKELAARIRALLRRASLPAAPSSEPEAFVFGDLEVRPGAGEVRRAGELVELTKTEFRLLCEFVANPGQVLSRDVLLERVWGYDYLGDSRLVDTHLHRLRLKVEDDPSEPRHLLTARGLGYKFVP
ncbi:MAG: response regulator transcription factor [Acidimicrobiales bacterium]|nr:response regulator transcription factor [Acidimicrobiales bacterium]